MKLSTDAIRLAGRYLFNSKKPFAEIQLNANGRTLTLYQRHSGHLHSVSTPYTGPAFLALLDAPMFFRLIKAIDAPTFQINLEDEKRVVVCTDNSTLRVPVYVPGKDEIFHNLSEMVQVQEWKALDIPMTALMKMVKFVHTTVSTDESRPALNKLRIEPDGDKIRMVSTTGYHMGIVEYPGQLHGELMIENDFFQSLFKHASTTDAKLEYASDSVGCHFYRLSLKVRDLTISTEYCGDIPDKYPPYRGIEDAENVFLPIEASRAELLSIYRSIITLSGLPLKTSYNDHLMSKLSYRSGVLNICFEKQDDMPVAYERKMQAPVTEPTLPNDDVSSEPQIGHIDALLLYGALNQMGGERIVMHLNSVNKRPLFVTSEHQELRYKLVVMPMHPPR